MNCEVIVVGGGIGGLTTAAILAARGMNVCLLERQSRVGGCIANFEKFEYSFEPTFGLYSGWEPGGTFERIFSELPLAPPVVRRVSPAYVVRLPDGTDVPVSEDPEQLIDSLRSAFPECVDTSIAFFRAIGRLDRGHESETPIAARLTNASPRFRQFVDVQLQTFAQCSGDQCSFSRTAETLAIPTRGMWTIDGGAQALANTLAESLKSSGGKSRLDSTALRLAFGSDGHPTGVDLLTGERIIATRAIISNLTVWDTYGKLIGLTHTPPAIARQLKQMHAWGAYLMFLGMDETACSRLPSDHMLVVTDWNNDRIYSPEDQQLSFNSASRIDPRAPNGKRAVTVGSFTRVEDWFAFHQNEDEHEQQDQAMLERCWKRMHSAMPELGDSIEVIETATPRTLYETTRRKFGMVGAPSPFSPNQKLEKTVFPNVFLVGDTIAGAVGVEGAVLSALSVGDRLLPS